MDSPRDPAQGVINLFGWLMAAVFLASAACVVAAGWFLWQWMVG